MRRAAGAVSALLSLLPLTALAGAAAAAPPGPASWPDDATSRLEALALVETLNADLLAHDSATLTLERWCGSHGLASPPTVTAARVPEAETPADEAVRRQLGVDAAEPVRHRHVRLSCGCHVVSEADNYYLPARLTPEMNRALDTTDTAFGRAVAALKFQRRTLSAELLWRPLPPGWERADALPPPAPGALAVPPEVLRHRAVLVLPDGTPFSALVETYTGEVLAFPKPPPR
ncbi:hypothetical protein [Lichenibacterium dinghuense]|uniref:hypothetical protein n=1 Tax=Lichenibacterium dinghuense TaxID=2895977 RepID=UPI001F2A5A1A|nr:hypothetical protein [Lichenibacterium sp. 6Y81]